MDRGKTFLFFLDSRHDQAPVQITLTICTRVMAGQGLPLRNKCGDNRA